MNDLHSARACRSYAGIISELAPDLISLEAAFLRHVVSDQLSQPRKRPLNLRRAKVAAWPDLLKDLDNSSKRRSAGLPVDVDDLKARATAIADEMEAADILKTDEAQIPQMRNVAGMTTTPPPSTGEFPDWTQHFGRQNPSLHSPRKLANINRQISSHPFLRKLRLEDILLARFLAHNIGAHGSLGAFTIEAYGYYDSKWYWQCNDELREDLLRVVSKAINQTSRPCFQILAVLWKHPHNWRYATSSDAAARAAVEAITAIYDVVRAELPTHIIAAENMPEVHNMWAAIDRLETARASLAEELVDLYPNASFGGIERNRIDEDVTGRVFEIVRSSRIKLSAPRRLKDRFMNAMRFWFSRLDHRNYYLGNTYQWYSKPRSMQ